jgi:hypothetical protein
MKKMTVMALVLIVFFLLSGTPVLAQTCLSGYCPCKGNFDCDKDVDGGDAAVFKQFYGVSPFNAVCRPHCQALVPQTGQTTSYATGDDGDFEKGIAWEDPRFYDNEDGTVTDGLTGLVWMKEANCFGQRSWNNALSDCNGLASGSCGLTDGSSAGEWRLPNSNELASLVHKGYIEPAIPNTTGTGQWTQGDPFTNVQLWYYWSSTVFAAFSGIAWHVDMVDGHVYHYDKTSTYHVWCVRGGQ